MYNIVRSITLVFRISSTVNVKGIFSASFGSTNKAGVFFKGESGTGLFGTGVYGTAFFGDSGGGGPVGGGGGGAGGPDTSLFEGAPRFSK